MRGRFDFDGRALTVAPSQFREARETSALAAASAAPAKARRATELLRLVDAAGDPSISDPEIARATGWPRSSSRPFGTRCGCFCGRPRGAR
jgi:hypothetical protein